jgi:Short C-terminal domain
MIGGAGYMAGKSGQRAAYREDDEQQRLSQLESQAATSPAPPAPAAGGDLVSKIKELSQLKDAGALTDSEFEAAKAKLLAS